MADPVLGKNRADPCGFSRHSPSAARSSSRSPARCCCRLPAAVVWSAIPLACTSARTRSREQAASIAATSAAYLNQYLDGLDSLASALARHPAVDGARRAASAIRLFEDMLRDQPLLLNIVVADTAGAVQWQRRAVRRATRLSPTSMPYVNEVVRTGKPQVSELMTGRIDRQPTDRAGLSGARRRAARWWACSASAST